MDSTPKKYPSSVGLTQPSPESSEEVSYAAAGVSIDAGNSLVDRIKPMAAATARPGVIGGVGGFGSLFSLKDAGYEDPILVSGTDGVGTKLAVAKIAAKHDTIGIDLVAMCVNDLVVQAAEPLFFLDYFATGKLAVDEAAAVVQGVADGCRQAGCALAGGETAEMPGMYAPGDYDVAGFCVGAVDRKNLLPRTSEIGPDCVALGIASSGIHSNGFSLVRHIVQKSGADWNAPPPFSSNCDRLCDALLAPTKIYVKSMLETLKHHRAHIHALAHITGGGLLENIPRVLPSTMCVHLDAASWKLPAVFKWLQVAGGCVAPLEMARTFNLGIGMVLIVNNSVESAVRETLTELGEQVFHIGVVKSRVAEEPQVVFSSLDQLFS